MTLRNRIALSFSMVTTLIFGSVLLGIYLATARYTEQEFLERLFERANLIQKLQFESDVLSQEVLQELQQYYQRPLLPEEQEYFLRLDQWASWPDVLTQQIDSAGFFRQLKKEGKASLSKWPSAGIALLYPKGNKNQVTLLTAHDRYGQSKLRNLRLVMGTVLLLYLSIVFFLGRWYAHSALSPLTAIIERLKLVNTANLHHHIPEPSQPSDELTQLTRSFNHMLDRLAAAMEAQQHFISNASHQLKNPLTAILGEAETALQSQRSPEEYQRSLQTIEEEANRLRALVLHLLRLAHTSIGPESMSEWRIDELLFELVDEFRELEPSHLIRIDFSSFPLDSDQLSLYANRQLLKIALSNLLENAFKFSSGKEVFLRLETREKSLRLTISDRGIGISDVDLPNVFSPFFRGENARHLPGFGIGLPLVKRIVELHDGKIDMHSTLGKGSKVSIELPRRPSPLQEASNFN